MTETTEQTIARLAKERAKTILENGDFWGSPGAANTSAQCIGTLLSYRYQLQPDPEPVKFPALEETPAIIVKAKRAEKVKEPASANIEANAEPDPADV